MRETPMLRLLAAPFILLLHIIDARAEPPQAEDRAGDVYELQLVSVSETSQNGSSGNSSTRGRLVERVIAPRDGGIELEFDLPERVSPKERALTWQLPVRVLKSPGRPLQLLNRSELDERAHAWMRTGGITEAACGRWIFTWTAIKIECDPESALQILEPFDLRSGNLRDGAPHSEPGARGTASLRASPTDSGGATYAAEMDIDADMMRRERAKADVAVAEMTGRPPLSYEAALQARQNERISGSIATTFECDGNGRVTLRRRITRTEIAGEAGSLERQTTTETVTRRFVPPGEQRP